MDDLQTLLDLVVENTEERRLTLNAQKTIFVTITKAQKLQEILKVRDELVENINKY